MAFVQLGPGTMLSPVPAVMVTCAREAMTPNIITLSWVGTVCTDPPMLSISVRPQRHSHDIIAESGEFVVNLVGRDLLKACDFCGVRSGRDLDKFAACGLDPIKAEGMKQAPAIAQSPLHLSCKVTQSIVLGSHTMFLATIVAVGAQENLMDTKGRLDLTKADLVVYSHGEYAALSQPEGFFGYSVARSEVLARRLRRK